MSGVGYTASEVDGRVIVAHASDGTKISCGRLGSIPSASLDSYPDYSDSSYNPRGFVAVRQKVDYSCDAAESTLVFLHYFLNGVGAASTTGGIHIHSGDTCEDASSVGGHDYDATVLSTDPWTTMWTSEGDSVESIGNFEVQAAKDLDDVKDRNVVVHSPTGTKVSCGVLSASNFVTPDYPGCPPNAEPVATATDLSSYPGYSGSIMAQGVVLVSDDVNGGLKLQYDISGLEPWRPEASYIHSGTSCDTVSDPGGHHWTPTSNTDPWTTTYTSDANGNAQGSFVVSGVGYTASQVDGRVIVAHASDGTKISCGRLGSIPSTSVDTYPGYNSFTYHPRGWVAVRQKQDESCNAGESTLSFHYF